MVGWLSDWLVGWLAGGWSSFLLLVVVMVHWVWGLVGQLGDWLVGWFSISTSFFSGIRPIPCWRCCGYEHVIKS